MERFGYRFEEYSKPGMGKMIVLDSNIIIEILKGNENIISKIKEINPDNLYITYITKMEVMYGARNKNEKETIKKFLNEFKILFSNELIDINAINLIDEFSLSHNANLPDMIIASIVVYYGAQLMTLNVKDFHYISDLRIYTS